MINCKIKHCKNSRDGKGCRLPEVTIEFNADPEIYSAYCSNFEESDEYRKETYRYYELAKNIYLIHKTRRFEAIDLEMFSNEIKGNGDKVVIIDNLFNIFSSKSSNRFTLCKYNDDKNDFEDFKTTDKLTIYDKKVREITCNYARENDFYGILSSAPEKMIKKGMNL